ncbi:hypothetical protein R1sor_009643 [Riccia sorocarpa]|uniref:PPIase cyclophilin-type domain-containing protein n=1 Tax=Riccia sorocarpa TaxID=122646 RepID=A0ABD3HVP5_9MARC
MSSVYVLEPPTKGKVVLNTSLGPLDFELWAKEAPKAVRNFVQLCLEGYYDNTIFHRIIKGFMIQGGDPTGTGTGGDTIYGEPFADEFHSRLRFNHRGLVACANAGSANSNNSQFFMTLDRCDWLDKKHTIFGKVTGETVYNLIKIGEVEIDKDDRPIEPPRILSVEVLWNPFDDLVPRSLQKSSEIQEKPGAVTKPEKTGKKGKKELNLLSFGEEAEEEEQELASAKEKKIKSSHDVLRDPRLLKASSDVAEQDATEVKRRKDAQESVRQALGGSAKGVDRAQKIQEVKFNESDEDEADFDKRMREQIMKKRMNLGDVKEGGSGRKQSSSSAKKSNRPPRSVSPNPKGSSRNAERLKEDDDSDEGAEKKEKLIIKKKGLGSEARAELAAAGDLDMQLLTPLEQQRAKYKQRKRTLQGREEGTLAKLEMFKKTLMQSKEKTAKPAAPEKPEDDEGWLTHSLKFVADSKRDDMSRNDDPNQYVVQDPLLEKGKEKFNKMQAKLKKRGREWAGNSLTAVIQVYTMSIKAAASEDGRITGRVVVFIYRALISSLSFKQSYETWVQWVDSGIAHASKQSTAWPHNGLDEKRAEQETSGLNELGPNGNILEGSSSV